MKNVSVYRNPAAYAEANNEIAQYRESFKANVACKEAIEAAIVNHYHDNRLDKEAVTEVVDQFGAERVAFVLAATVQVKDWDARFLLGSKAWAREHPTFEDLDQSYSYPYDRRCRYVVDHAHPGLTDLFLANFRREYEVG